MPVPTSTPKTTRRPALQPAPMIVQIIKMAEAWFGIDDFRRVMEAPITPETHRQYLSLLADVLAFLGLTDRDARLRRLENACLRQGEPGHSDYWYDAAGFVYCQACLPRQRWERRRGIVQPLDLDACPTCLDDGEIWRGGGGTGYDPCPDCEYPALLAEIYEDGMK